MCRLMLCLGIVFCTGKIYANNSGLKSCRYSMFDYNSFHVTELPDTLNYQLVEQLTYRFFTEQKWDSVILIGRKAIQQEIDYHYLRVRLGISFFEEGKYREAVKQLYKSLEFNSANETAKQYLYLSLLYSEQYEAAGKIACQFDDSTASLMKTNHHPVIDLAGAEAGTKFCSDSVLGNVLFSDIVISHRIGKAVSFTHAATYYNQQGAFNKISQWEYFLGSNIPLAKSWLISPSVHFIFLDMQVVVPYLDKTIKIPFLDTSLHSTQTVTSLAVKKSFPLFDAALSGSWSNLYDTSYLQETFGVNLYPLLNNKITLGASLIINQDSLKLDSNFSYSAFFKYRFSSTFDIQFNYFKGNALFMNEYNGFLVNNSPDLTISKFSILPSLYLSKHFRIYGLLQSEQKQDYKPEQLPGTNEYNYITVLTGIKFIF